MKELQEHHFFIDIKIMILFLFFVNDVLKLFFEITNKRGMQDPSQFEMICLQNLSCGSRESQLESISILYLISN